MHPRLLFRYALPFLSLAAACNLADPNVPKSLTLSVVNTLSSPGINGDVIVGTGANSLKITKVEFVLAHIELSQASTCSVDSTDSADSADSTDSTDSHDEGCDEVEVNPVLVNLPLDGPPKAVLDGLVPAGTYSRLQAQLAVLEGGDETDDGAPAAQVDPTFPTGVSVRVTGVYTDTAGVAHDFTFTSDARAEIEMAFATPVDVRATTQNLTIAVDVASWFKDASGGVIDPTNSANAEAIEHNIRASFHSFEDDNHDGVDDHHDGASH